MEDYRINDIVLTIAYRLSFDPADTMSWQSRGDFIVVGDLMRSVSLLVYKAVDGAIEVSEKITCNTLPRCYHKLKHCVHGWLSFALSSSAMHLCLLLVRKSRGTTTQTG